MKATLKTSAALVLGLAFVLAIVPAVNSAEHKASPRSVAQIIKLPTLLSPSLHAFTGTLGNTLIDVTAVTPAGAGKVRPTDVIDIPKPGTGD